ncbi:MAG: TipAS antibiotic-recognition domain-containing protein, partial [Acidimicrobiales bacterium]
VADASKGDEAVSVTDFLELIRKVITVDDTVKQYFSDEQLADLAERRAQLGEQAITQAQKAWPELIAQVQAAVDAGLDPAAPQAQKLAAEWMELLGQFHGDDEGLRDSLYRMQAENAQQIEQQHGGPSPALLEFIKAAHAARA